jgi:SAM-dependent methyltransferase
LKLNRFSNHISRIKWREFAVTRYYCPICSANRLFVRLNNHEMGVRCLTCRATAVTLSLASVLLELIPDLSTKKVYELSSRGPLVKFLKSRCEDLTCSEYFEGVNPGEYLNGVLCQDVQQLSFADNSFDICTSTEVFEHVPDDIAGFAEIQRVLRPGGLFLFTVPLFNTPAIVERARLDDTGKVEHTLPAQYHGDPIRGHQPVLVFRDYGMDIKQRILSQGFSRVELRQPPHSLPWGYHRQVIAAYN